MEYYKCIVEDRMHQRIEKLYSNLFYTCDCHSALEADIPYVHQIKYMDSIIFSSYIMRILEVLEEVE